MSNKHIRYTDEQLLEFLKNFYIENGCSPSIQHIKENRGKWPSERTFDNRFGSWNNALRIAGLPINKEMRGTETVICKTCMKEFIAIISASAKFCSSSCSATFNNTGRAGSEKQKLAVTASNQKRKYKDRPRYACGHVKPINKLKNCIICGNVFSDSKRKTCSLDCHKAKLSINGRSRVVSLRSKDEMALFDFCKEFFKNVSHNEHLVEGWDADIILHDEKIAILWNGPWHYREMPGLKHSLKQVQTRDRIKIEKLSKAGWTIMVFEDDKFTPQKAFQEILRRVNLMTNDKIAK